jgi:hypothetical protein
MRGIFLFEPHERSGCFIRVNEFLHYSLSKCDGVIPLFDKAKSFEICLNGAIDSCD